MEDKWRDVPGFNGRYKIDISTPEGECLSMNYRGTGKNGCLNSKPDKRDGRIYWGLRKNGVYKKLQAARWIAITYPELVQNEYFEGAEIDHIDTNKLNNHPSNLRWVTSKENMNNPLTKQHISEAQKGEKHYLYGKFRTEETRKKISEATKGEKNHNYGIRLSEETKRKMSEVRKGKQLNRSDQSKEVIQLDLDGNVIATYPSTMQAERETGVGNTHIGLCCNGKAKTAGTRNGPKYIWKYKQ